MSVTCEKTGFQARLPGGAYIYGDAFELGRDHLLFRICYIGQEPNGNRVHYDIMTWEQWFDEGKTSMDRNSTMIASKEYVRSFGYEGVAIPSENR